MIISVAICISIPFAILAFYNDIEMVLVDDFWFGVLLSIPLSLGIYGFLKFVRDVIVMVKRCFQRNPVIIANEAGLTIATLNTVTVPWDTIDFIEKKSINKSIFNRLIVYLIDRPDEEVKGNIKRLFTRRPSYSISSAWYDGDTKDMALDLMYYRAKYTREQKESQKVGDTQCTTIKN